MKKHYALFYPNPRIQIYFLQPTFPLQYQLPVHSGKVETLLMSDHLYVRIGSVSLMYLNPRLQIYFLQPTYNLHFRLLIRS